MTPVNGWAAVVKGLVEQGTQKITYHSRKKGTHQKAFSHPDIFSIMLL